jgi:hypothetical protein
MESVDIVHSQIPDKEKYYICLLDSYGKPTRIIAFNGTSTQTTEEEMKKHLFSNDEELMAFDLIQPAPEFHNSIQQLHKDDSVRAIKKKILHEIGINEISYDEIYIFSKRLEHINLLKTYQEITKNDQTILDKRTIGQFLLNAQIDKSIVEDLLSLGKINFTYEDLLKRIGGSTIKSNLSIPIGQKFSVFRNILFSGNPFDVLSGDGEPVFQKDKKNDLYTFENQLLLNYGDIINNVIYVCFAEDVLDYSMENGLNSEYMIELYYPSLYKKNIRSKETLLEERQNLIEDNKKLIKPQTLKLYDTIDCFYDIYHGRSSELNYTDIGINEFDIIIHPEFDIPLPLEIIFKQMHSTKEMPFIKYNPGPKREALFRLYSEVVSKNGKKIPYLSRSKIVSISKTTGKIRQISVFIQHKTSKQDMEIFLDFEFNGNLRVRSSFSKPISVNDMETIIYNSINPIIISVNKFLEKSGYKIATFQNIKDENIEVINLNYESSINADKKINLKKYIGCLTSIFDITDTSLDVSKGILLQFIRVDNYRKMDAISTMITEVFRKTNSKEDILNALIINYQFNRDEALRQVVKYFNDHTRIHGQYVNKQMDIVDNPGFPISIKKSPFDNKITIRINQINSIFFIDILHVYFDTILRLSQEPEGIHEELLNKMNALCGSGGKKQAVEEHVDNLIVTNNVFVPLAFERIYSDEPVQTLGAIYEEDEEDEDEDEDDDRYLPGEEEEEDEDEKEEQPVTEDVEHFLPGGEDEEEVELENKIKEHNSTPKDEEEEEKEDQDEEEDDRFLPDYDEDEFEGGGRNKKTTTPSSVETIAGVKSNIFTKRLQEREPKLILTRKQGNFTNYSRVCPANVSLQPVILTEEEKQRIDREHPGSYTNALQYGTDPKKPFWYICPRYWCLKTNMPLTEEEVARGECGGKIIKDNSKPPPPDHYIYEFTDDVYHKKKDGEYVYHSPGFKKGNNHPDGYCLPCCYNKWSSYKPKNPSEQQTRRQQCGLVDKDVLTDEIDEKTGKQKPKLLPDGKNPVQVAVPATEEELEIEKMDEDVLLEKKEKEKVKQMKKNNVFNIERLPIPQYRWGFLPLSVELFLHTDNSKFISKNNASVIQPHTRPLLRYGVEQSAHQSFIGAIADIYGSSKNVKLPTIIEMREIIASSLTLDNYLKLHNGSLVTIFKPSKIKIDDVTVENYSETEFYNKIDKAVPAQYAFLKDSISSFENFLSFLRDNDAFIDHTYLWDIISSPESRLFEGGLNMVIMRILDNDSTDNMEIICPTNSYSEHVYIKNRGTILLLKHNDFYEPIYLYEDKDKASPIPPVKIFTNNVSTPELAEVNKIFNIISKTSGRYCKPKSTRPSTYEYKENITFDILYDLVTKEGFVVLQQVMNYRGKVIGITVKIRREDNTIIFLPCFPSSEKASMDKIFIDNVQWSDYVSTRDNLTQISNKTGGKILCKPLVKVVEDGLIVGIITETNQFINIDPPTENVIEDGIPVFEGPSYKDNGYILADNSLAVSKKYDEKRVLTVRNISLETQFYMSFRSIIRNLLNDYANRELRDSIIEVINNTNYLYNVKMKKLELLLRQLSKHSIQFVDEIDENIKKVFENEANCSTNCDVKSYCLMKKNKICIPKKHLVSGIDNNVLYYSRAADELLRYKRIQLFMLEAKRYLNITNVDYSIYDNEVLLLNSVLMSDYFDDLVPFQTNPYVQNVTYDIANPSRNTKFYQHYSDEVPLKEQTVEE